MAPSSMPLDSCEETEGLGVVDLVWELIQDIGLVGCGVVVGALIVAAFFLRAGGK